MMPLLLFLRYPLLSFTRNLKLISSTNHILLSLSAHMSPLLWVFFDLAYTFHLIIIIIVSIIFTLFLLATRPTNVLQCLGISLHQFILLCLAFSGTSNLIHFATTAISHKFIVYISFSFSCPLILSEEIVIVTNVL